MAGESKSTINQNVTRAAGIVSIAVMGSRILGLAREVAIAFYFPARTGADAFYLAFRIPNFLRDLFGEGILSKAFITTFLATEGEEGEEAAWHLANRVFNLTALILLCITILGIAFAPAIVDVLTRENFEEALDTTEHYGFSSKVELTIYLTQLMFPYLLFVSLAAIAMGLLNSKGRFGVPACASSFFNLSSLFIGVGGYYVCQQVGMHPVTGMAVGVIVGGIAQFVIQVPSMYRVGFRYRPLLSLRDARVRQVFSLIAPAVLGVAAVQINQFTNTFFITEDSGWLTWINRAYRVMHLPIGIFGVAISTVALPQLARFATAGETENFRNALAYALRLMLALTIPASVGLMVLSAPICRLLYERGQTFEVDTLATAGGTVCLRLRVVWIFCTQDCDRRLLRLQRHPRAGDCQRLRCYAQHRAELSLYLSRVISRASCSRVVYRFDCDAELFCAPGAAPPQSRQTGTLLAHLPDVENRHRLSNDGIQLLGGKRDY